MIVKIYRLETCDFNRMYDHLKYDSRYHNLKGKKRKVIFAWVQREYRNLLKARAVDVRVPTPIACLNNVMVLEFMGDNEIAPKLKDKLPKDPKDFFKRVVNYMKKLHKAKLVHADLSAFNILNYNEKPIFIDFSQCTTLDNPRARDFLDSDIRNICTFFRKLGLNVQEDKVKKSITYNKA